jgi:hypothetical protein
MNENNSQKTEGPSRKSIFERIGQLFQGEPQNREELVEVFRDSEENDLIDHNTRDMLEGVMQISEMRVRDIMIPRSQMITIERSQELESLIDVIIDSQHSRYPVISDDKDHVEGILLAKDLLRYLLPSSEPFDINKVLRPAVVVPEVVVVGLAVKVNGPAVVVIVGPAVVVVGTARTVVDPAVVVVVCSAVVVLGPVLVVTAVDFGGPEVFVDPALFDVGPAVMCSGRLVVGVVVGPTVVDVVPEVVVDGPAVVVVSPAEVVDGPAVVVVSPAEAVDGLAVVAADFVAIDDGLSFADRTVVVDVGPTVAVLGPAVVVAVIIDGPAEKAVSPTVKGVVPFVAVVVVVSLLFVTIVDLSTLSLVMPLDIASINTCNAVLSLGTTDVFLKISFKSTTTDPLLETKRGKIIR